jgi:phage tail-like protein
MTTTTLDPGSSLFFKLTIDGQDLGLFNQCEGLSAEVEVYQHKEGGNNGYTTFLPGRVSHGNITLTRPLTPDSGKIAAWISSIATGIQRPTAQIAALRANGTMVVQWGLLDVLPVSWSGPTLDPTSNTVATERLVIAHHGFTESGA